MGWFLSKVCPVTVDQSLYPSLRLRHKTERQARWGGIYGREPGRYIYMLMINAIVKRSYTGWTIDPTTSTRYGELVVTAGLNVLCKRSEEHVLVHFGKMIQVVRECFIWRISHVALLLLKHYVGQRSRDRSWTGPLEDAILRACRARARLSSYQSIGSAVYNWTSL